MFVKNWKSPVTNIRKMLLMKDRSFLYELRAYLIYVKVGESVFPVSTFSKNRIKTENSTKVTVVNCPVAVK